MIKNKIFKQGIGIAEKSQETRRDGWGGNCRNLGGGVPPRWLSLDILC